MFSLRGTNVLIVGWDNYCLYAAEMKETSCQKLNSIDHRSLVLEKTNEKKGVATRIAIT
jgi:hypothetical protein